MASVAKGNKAIVGNLYKMTHSKAWLIDVLISPWLPFSSELPHATKHSIYTALESKRPHREGPTSACGGRPEIKLDRASGRTLASLDCRPRIKAQSSTWKTYRIVKGEIA